MRYGSVCSGIEAATAAWHHMGWEAAFFSEIEKFPCAVLQHHYPDVPLHGDFTTIKGNEYGKIDLLVGGTPCQSFSVAGLRGGLDDDRGNLALEFCRLAQREQPRWIVWENVPGVLSSNGGRDFGSILGALENIGYGLAYRVLDAQYFGVAQRRRRVFVVGYLGDWRPAAAVLFERHSMSGHPAPSRQARQEAAGTATTGAGGSGGNGGARPDLAAGNPSVTGSLCARTGRSISVQDAEQGHLVTGPDVVGTLRAHHPGTAGTQSDTDHIVTVDAAHAFKVRGGCEGGGKGYLGSDEVAFTISTHQDQHIFSEPVAYAIQERAVCENPDAGPDGIGVRADNAAYTLEARSTPQAVAFQPTADCLTAAYGTKWNGNASATNGSLFAQQQSTVRRLTPVECERLQGFPDNFTAIPWRKKGTEDCPDGPRYKALGNSMAVPVMRWIGERIQTIEEITK